MSGKISMARFEEYKEVFLADVAAEVIMNGIPESLIINWDQTGLSIVPSGEWTMEKEGTKIVPIAHSDDKRQLTAVLAVTAAGDYLPPQLLFQGKTPKCHPQVKFPDGCYYHTFQNDVFIKCCQCASSKTDPWIFFCNITSKWS